MGNACLHRHRLEEATLLLWDQTANSYQRGSGASNCTIWYQKVPLGRDCEHRCWPQPGSTETNLDTKGRMSWNKSAWERKRGETESEIPMLLGALQRASRAERHAASTGLHEGRLRVWAWPQPGPAGERAATPLLQTRELPGWQAKPVSASHAAAFCLCSCWGLADRLALCRLPGQRPAQHQGLSVLLEGRAGMRQAWGR